jgi:hydroxymethylglutaryl-CoA lyase
MAQATNPRQRIAADERAVVINEVGPRDGLQNQPRVLSPQQRLALIEALAGAGLQAIEVGSFVSPKAVPAMAGADAVIAGLPRADIYYSALVPNHKGYELARATGIRALGLILAATNTFNEKNLRMSTAQTEATVLELIECCRRDGIDALVYLSTAWECPYEGLVAERVVLDMAARMFAAGATEVIVSDTIGAAHPGAVKSLMAQLVREFGAQRLTCHFHDTRGMALANVYAALETGIRKYDASIAGLGGCPFAPGATGNVATEDVALLLAQSGYHTGIDLGRLVAAAELAAELTGAASGGHALRWLKRQREQGRL